MTQSLRDSAEGPRRAGANKNPVYPVEFARDLVRRLLSMNILVRDVCILIEPYRPGLRSQQRIYSLEPAAQVPSGGVTIFDDYDLCTIKFHASDSGVVGVRIRHADELIPLDRTDQAECQPEISG